MTDRQKDRNTEKQIDGLTYYVQTVELIDILKDRRIKEGKLFH